MVPSARLFELLTGDGRDPAERTRLVRLLQLFAALPAPPDPDGDFPRYAELQDHLVEACHGDDGDPLEEAFLELYAHVHMHEAPYTVAERRRMDETGGYWCHAGGISPVLKAGPWLHADTVSADYGAGNGLQGLLFQVLDPHRKTIQIDISSRALAIGRRLQGWLGIPGERVEWIAADVMDVPPRGMDFVYLYRPVRPEGEGRRFYEQFAAQLTDAQGVTIFSIADCLGPFLPPAFEEFYSDGHLTCYRARPEG